MGRNSVEFLNLLFLIICLTNVHGYNNCSKSLGMKSWGILDGQLSASRYSAHGPPWRGRLERRRALGVEKGTWYTDTPLTSGDWIRVDLILPHTITGIATHGHTGRNAWITSYSIKYSMDNKVWNSELGMFAGNSDTTTTVRNDFAGIIARYVKIYPTSTAGGGALNFELYGCVQECPEVPPTAVVSTSPCSCTSAGGGESGSVCKSYPGTSTTLSSLHLITGARVRLATPFYSYPFSLQVRFINPKGSWATVSGIEVTFTTDTDVEVNFPRLVKATEIRIKIQTTKLSWCAGYTLLGKKADACPPGHVHFRRSCYRTSGAASIQMMTSSQRKICSRATSWGKPGYLATLSDWYESGFVHNLQGRDNLWVGLFLYNLTKPPWVIEPRPNYWWKWQDGEDLGTWNAWDWDTGQPQERYLSQENCTLLIQYGRWYDRDCQLERNYVCEVPATEMGDDWVWRRQDRVRTYEGAPYQVLPSLTVAECLRHCQTETFPECYTVVYNSSSRACSLYSSMVGDGLPSSDLTEPPDTSGTYTDIFMRRKASEESCNFPLVWTEDNNKTLSVSSEKEGFVAEFAQYQQHGSKDCWYSTSGSKEWFQVEFDRVVKVTRIVLKGSASKGKVRRFYLLHSNTTEYFHVAEQDEAAKIFRGNNLMQNEQCSQHSFVHPAIVAKIFRIKPLDNDKNGMQFELYGCVLHGVQPTTELNGVALGMQSMDIMDSQMSQRTSNPTHPPWSARYDVTHVVSSDVSWAQLVGSGDWWQVDLILPHLITGMKLQPSTDGLEAITKYRIKTALHIANLTWYRDSKMRQVEFVANLEQSANNPPIMNALQPLVRTRYLRIYSLQHRGARALKLELYGQPDSGCKILQGETISNTTITCATCEQDRVCMDVDNEIETSFKHMILLTSIKIRANTTKALGGPNVTIHTKTPRGNWKLLILAGETTSSYPMSIHFTESGVEYRLGRIQRSLAIRITTTAPEQQYTTIQSTTESQYTSGQTSTESQYSSAQTSTESQYTSAGRTTGTQYTRIKTTNGPELSDTFTQNATVPVSYVTFANMTDFDPLNQTSDGLTDYTIIQTTNQPEGEIKRISECVQFTIEGCLPAACPPGFAQFGAQCFSYVPYTGALDTQEARDTYCKRDDGWAALSHIGTPKSIEESAFFHYLAKGRENDPTKTFLGLRKISNSPDPLIPGASSTWRIFDEPDEATNTFRFWGPGEPSSGDGGCGMDRGGSGTTWVASKCTISKNYTCQTDALDKGSEFTNKWKASYKKGIDNPEYEISGVTVTECLYYCETETLFMCRSVDYHYLTGVCSLNSITAFQHAPGLKSQHSTHWERVIEMKEAVGIIFATDGTLNPGVNITASSWRNGWEPRRAWMSGSRAWYPEDNNNRQYLQVDFGGYYAMNKLSLRGIRHSGNNYWVESFYLLYSNNSLWWHRYGTNEQIKEVVGNSDPRLIEDSIFTPPIYTRFVRINPRQWNNNIRLRVEAYGVKLDQIYQSPLSCTSCLMGHDENDNGGRYSHIRVNGANYLDFRDDDGILMVTVNESKALCSVVDQFKYFDDDEYWAYQFLRNVPDGLWILGTTMGDFDVTNSLMRNYFLSEFDLNISHVNDRDKFAFAVKKGDPTQSEMLHLERYASQVPAYLTRDLRGSYGSSYKTAPLGMMTGDIVNTQLMEGVEFMPGSVGDYEPGWVSSARLYNSIYDEEGHSYDCWCPQEDWTRFSTYWVQVTLLSPHGITGIVVSGSYDRGYLLDSFKVTYSDSVNGFFQSYKVDGEEVNFKGTHDFRSWRHAVALRLEPEITAKVIRIAPNVKSSQILKFELLGYPQELPEMDVREFLVPGAEISTSCLGRASSCIRHCASGTSSFQITLTKHRIISHINVISENGLSTNNSDISIHMLREGKWRAVKGVFYERPNSTNDSLTLKFSPLVQTAYMKILSSGQSECHHYVFFGNRAKACPPGSIQYRSVCFHVSKERGTWEAGMRYCNSIIWAAKRGKLAKVDNWYRAEYITQILRSNRHPQVNTAAFVGATIYSFWFRWFSNMTSYKDYSSAPVDTLAAGTGSSRRSAVTVHIPGIRSYYYLNRLSYVCEVPSAAKKDEEMEWFMKDSMRMPGAYVYRVSSSNRPHELAQCLEECEENCTGVNIRRLSGVGVCQFVRVDDSPFVREDLLVEAGNWFFYYKFYRPKECDSPLLKAKRSSGTVSLSASSYYSSLTSAPYGEFGRWKDKYWRPSSSGSTTWFRATFTNTVKIYGIITRGGSPGYVKKFRLYYKESVYGGSTSVRDKNGNPRIFKGNLWSSRYTQSIIDPPILTRSIYYNPRSWSGSISAAIEYRGCDSTEADEKTDYPLGMKSDDLSLAQVTGSSYKTISGVSYDADYGRLDNSLEWRPDTGIDANPWIQVDMIVPHQVNAILSQTSNINKLKFAYSNDGIIWEEYVNSEGNPMSYDMDAGPIGGKISTIFENPIISRYVRVLLANFGSSPEMRFEIFGVSIASPGIANGTNIQQPLLTSSSAAPGWPAEGGFVYTDHSYDVTPWCADSSDTDPYIDINLRQLYIVTGVVYGNTSTILSASYKFSRDGITWDIYTHALTLSSVIPVPDSREVIFTGAKKLKILRIHNLVSSGNESCLQVNVQGKVTLACPPGFVQYETKCFLPTNLTATQNDAVTQCNRVKWSGLGKLATPTNYDEIHFIEAITFSQHWTGYKKSGGQWKDSDGVVVTSSLPWYTAEPGSHECSVVRTLGPSLRGKPCSFVRSIICETDAQVVEGEKVPRWLWMKNYRQDSGLSETIIAMELSACLSTCLLKGDACASINYFLSTRICQILSITRGHHSSNLIADTDSYYFEVYYKADDCEDAPFINGVTPLPDAMITGTAGTDGNHDLDKIRLRKTFPPTPDNTFWKTSTSPPASLRINLGAARSVVRVAVQGSGTIGVDFYPTEYFMVYSETDMNLWKIMEFPTQNAQRYPALTDRYSIHEYALSRPIQVWRFLLEITQTFPASSSVSVHLELYGCNGTARSLDCSSFLGLSDNNIHNTQLSSSSSLTTGVGYKHLAVSGRLGFLPAEKVAAFWRPDPVTDTESWLQVSLIIPHRITGVMIQGDVTSDNYVTSFSLQYSDDNRNWTADHQAGVEKIYPGAFEASQTYYSAIKPAIETKYLRIIPQSFNGGIALQWELVGCPLNSALLPHVMYTTQQPATYISDNCSIADHHEDSLYSNQTCYFWCFNPSETTPTLEYTLLTYNYFSGVHIFTTDNTTEITDVNIEISTDFSTWEYFTMENLTLSSSLEEEDNAWKFDITLNQMRRTKFVRVKILSWTSDLSELCTRINIHGYNASRCPYGYAQLRDSCYYAGRERVNQASAKILCNSDRWGSPLHLGVPDSPFKQIFINGINQGDSNGSLWIDGYWDGTRYKWITENVDFTWDKLLSDTTPASSNLCIKMDKNVGIWEVEDCTNDAQGFVCETKASNDTDYIWEVTCAHSPSDLDYFTEQSQKTSAAKCQQICETEECTAFVYFWANGSCFTSKVGLYNLKYSLVLDDSSACYWQRHQLAMCEKRMVSTNAYNLMMTSSSSVAGSDQLSPLEVDETGTGSPGYWRPATEDANQWIRYTFDIALKWKKLVIAGSFYTASDNGYVTDFRLKQTEDKVLWEYVKSLESLSQVHPGLGSAHEVKVIPLPPLIGYGLQIEPVSWEGHIALQAEIYACQYGGTADCFSHPAPVLDLSDRNVSLKCLGSSTVISLHQPPPSQGSPGYPHTWEDHRHGYGTILGDYWLGTEPASFLTTKFSYGLRVDMWGDDGRYDYAEFRTFKVDDEEEGYALLLDEYSEGTNGDGMLTEHSGQPFHTTDKDNYFSCGGQFGSWWFLNDTACYTSKLLPNPEVQNGTTTPGTSYWARDPSTPGSRGRDITQAMLRVIPMLDKYTPNIALNKPTYQSSTDGEWGPGRATDLDRRGDVSLGSCSLTLPGTDQWWAVDLLKYFSINLVRITNRADCCGDHLRDVSVSVGPSLSVTGTAVDTAGFSPCATFPGPSTPGATESIPCPSRPRGRVLLIQKTGNTQPLALCEVEVLPVFVGGPLNSMCNWNHDCAVEYSHCTIIQDGVRKFNFSCQCKENYLAKEGKCVAVADIEMVISPFTVSLVRAHVTNATLEVKYAVNYGIDFTNTSGADTNFNLTAKLSDWDCRLNTTAECGYAETVPTPGDQADLQRGARIAEINSLNLTVPISVPAYLCNTTRYLCITLTEGWNARFADPDTSNNIHCQDISADIICMPDIDLAVTDMTLAPGEEITRGYALEVTFLASVIHPGPAAVYYVIPMLEEARNFRAYYSFRDDVVTSGAALLAGPNVSLADMPLAHAQLGIGVSQTKQVGFVVPIALSIEECVKLDILCAMITNDVMASYTESDIEDNAACISLNNIKNCDPPIEVNITMLNIRDDIELVRGYNITTRFEFTMENTIRYLAIEKSLGDSLNYDVTLTMTSHDVRQYGPAPLTLTLDTDVDSLAMLQQELVFNTTGYMSGRMRVMIPRDACRDLSHLCVEVTPGNASGYSLYNRTRSHVHCILLDRYKNCPGVAVENVTFTTSPWVIQEGGNISLYVDWLIGTDVMFSIDFGDGSPVFDWLWRDHDHVTHYGRANHSLSHQYLVMGNYTATLTIGNAVRNATLIRDTVVEPELSQYINFTLLSAPTAVPFPAVFSILPRAGGPPDPLGGGDGGEILVWCRAEFGDGTSGHLYASLSDEPHVFTHNYTTDVPDVTMEITCYNHVSNTTGSLLVILQEVVHGLEAVVVDVAFLTGSPAMFNSSLQNGTHVMYDVMWGDGSEDTLYNPDRLSYQGAFPFNHTFTSPGNYSLSITAYNKHFNTSTTVRDVIIQNTVHDLVCNGTEVVPVPPGHARFTIRPVDDVMPAPSDVFCTWEFAPGDHVTEYTPEISGNTHVTRTHAYGRGDVGRNLTMRAGCYNLASRRGAECSFTAQEVVSSLSVSLSTEYLAPNQTLHMTVSLENGSHVIYDFDYGDVGSGSALHPSLFASSAPLIHPHQYRDIGNYTLGVTASNLVSHLADSQDLRVVVQNPIRNLSLSGVSSILWPPGVVNLTLTSVQPRMLTDVHCVWDLEQGLSAYTYIATLEYNTNISQELTFPRSSIGNVTITVNCSNLISWMELPHQLEVIFDEVLLSFLTSNGTVLWSNTSTVILQVRRFGTHSCFVFDMGDGTQGVVYGVARCSVNATARGLMFVEIPHGQMEVTHDHVYENYGTYICHVFAFNHVSNDSLTTTVVVEDWPCFIPNITLPEDFITDDPFINMKSRPFTIPANLSIDCMKTERTVRTWKLYTKGETASPPKVSLEDTNTFLYTTRLLDYGEYEIHFRVAMDSQHPKLDTTGIERTEIVYIKIIKTPLVVAIDGNSSIYLKYNRSLTMNARDATFDLDVEPEDKSGMTFTWFCRKLTEAWPIKDGVLDRTSLVTSPRDSFYQYGGCYGFGAGILEEKEGIFINTTLDMFPFTDYQFRVVVEKDDRVGYTELNLTVGPVDPPVLEVRCRENCGKKKRFSGIMMSKVVCQANCQSKFGGLTLTWTLMIFNKVIQNYTEIPLLQHTETGIDKESVIIKANSLEGGIWHRLVVTGSTPGSPNASAYEQFIVNKPPFGGDCDVNPKDGVASKTMFSVTCYGWKEWNATAGSAGLKYEYRIRQAGNKRSLLFYYGRSTKSNPVVFPVGNFDMEFQNEVVIIILDSINDGWEKVINATVIPAPRPRQDIANEIEAIATGQDPVLFNQLNNSDVQGALTTIYSATSMINVPADWVHPDLAGGNGTDEVDMTKLVRTRSATRSRLINIMVQIDVDSPDSLEQQNEVFRSLLTRSEEVDLDSQQKSSGKLQGMTSKYIEFKTNITYEKSQGIAVDIMTTTIRLMIAADVKLTEPIPVMDKNESYITTAAPIVNMSESDPSTREKVGVVMQGTVDVVHDISDSLLEDMEEGDPSPVISFDEMSLLLAKEDETKLSNAKYQARQGSIKLPDINQLFNKTDNNNNSNSTRCYSRQIMFSKLNPYIWDSSEENVNTPIVEFSIDDCDKKGSRSKRALDQELKLAADIEVELKLDPQPQETINGTQPDMYGMIYNHLNLTEDPKPVQISVYPLGNRSLEIFVNITEDPTPENHRWNFTVPRNLSTEPTGKDMNSVYISAEDLFNGTLKIGVREKDCLPDRICEDFAPNEFPPFLYNLTLLELQCQLWDITTQQWTSANCKLEDSNTQNVKFKSNLFGSFGAGLIVAPNTINFGEIFSDFAQKLLDNIAVVAALVVTALSFIPLGILCRWFDKKDKKKWMILPLTDNFNEDKIEYELHVYTGFQNKTNTTSNVKFVLAGTKGDSGIRQMKDDVRKNFCKGEVDGFLMLTSHHVGEPLVIQVWHDNTGEGKHADWFLNKIILVDKQEDKWYLFKCDDWLAIGESDGRIERTLRVASGLEMQEDLSSLLHNNISRKLFDDHIWFSVGVRKNKSSFSRLQRLGCCFGILFLAMVVNAMWYGTEDQTKTQSAITFGPISFTVHELYVSFVSSLIIFPPSLIIITLFAKSAPKPKKDEKGKIPEDYVRPKGMLPYWCMYIAWVVTGVCFVLCVFFAVMYSLEFDKEKSSDWLISMLFSITQSIILMQPIKVLIMTILLTFLFKEDPDVSEHNKFLGKMAKTTADPNDIDIPYKTRMTEDELKEAREKLDTEKKMRHAVREIAYHVIFLVCLLFVCNMNQSENVFIQNQDLRNVFIKNLNKVKEVQTVYTWMETIVLPNLYFTEEYNGDTLGRYDETFISNSYGRRLGSPRLRQLRAIPEHCERSYNLHVMRNLNLRCSRWYYTTEEDRTSYDGKWGDHFNMSDIGGLSRRRTLAEQAFIYKTKEELKGSSFHGYLTYYTGGGYIANLGNSRASATSVINELKSLHWLDEYTRAIFLEFNIYNANTNLFNAFILALEFTPIGGMFTWRDIESVQLYRYTGPGGVISLVAELICIIYVIVSLVIEIRCIVKEKKAYFRKFWNVLHMISIILFIVALAFYIHRSIWTVKLLEEVMNNKDMTTNFAPLTTSNHLFLVFIGITTFLAQLNLLFLLRYNKTIAALAHTLQRSAGDLRSFAVCAFIIFLAFASGANKLFWQLETYMTLKQTISSLTAAFLGKFDFISLIQAYGIVGGVYLLIYLLTMIYLVVNIFIVILNEFMEEVNKDKSVVPKDHKVIDYFMKVLKSLIIKDKKKKSAIEPEHGAHPKNEFEWIDLPPLPKELQMDYSPELTYLEMEDGDRIAETKKEMGLTSQEKQPHSV